MSFYPLRPTLSRPIQVRSPAPLVHQDDIQQPYASTLKRPIRGRLLAPNTRHMILKESHWRGETPHIGLLLPHVPEALGCSHHGVSPCNYGIRLCLSPGNDIHSASYTFTTLTARLFPLQLRRTWVLTIVYLQVSLLFAGGLRTLRFAAISPWPRRLPDPPAGSGVPLLDRFTHSPRVVVFIRD